MLTSEQLQKAAAYAGDAMQRAHRGVVALPGAVLVFGNDGYGVDGQTRVYVDRVRAALAGDRELSAVANAPGDAEASSWAFAVTPNHSESEVDVAVEVGKVLTIEAATVYGNAGYQRAVAEPMIERHRRPLARHLGLTPPRPTPVGDRRMDPLGTLLLAKAGLDNVRLVAGGVPYAARAIELDAIQSSDAPVTVRPGCRMAVTLEDIGTPGADDGESDDSVFLIAGSIVWGEETGEDHPTTGEPMLRLIGQGEAIEPQPADDES